MRPKQCMAVATSKRRRCRYGHLCDVPNHDKVLSCIDALSLVQHDSLWRLPEASGVIVDHSASHVEMLQVKVKK